MTIPAPASIVTPATAKSALRKVSGSRPRGPGPRGNQCSRRSLIFVQSPGDKTSEQQAAQAVLTRFVTRAFRRPPRGAELPRWMAMRLAVSI